MAKSRETRFASYYTDNATRCSKCGHAMLFVGTKTICSWCKHYIYKDKKEEFKERLKYARKNNRGFEFNRVEKEK